MVGLTRCTSQVHCSQNPCSQGRPLMIHASTGVAQTLKCRSGSVTCGAPRSCAHKVLREPSKRLWWVCCLIQNSILPLQPTCWGFSFALGPGASFFDVIQHSPVNGCSAVSCNFGVLQEKLSTCPSTLPSSVRSILTIGVGIYALKHASCDGPRRSVVRSYPLPKVRGGGR